MIDKKILNIILPQNVDVDNLKPFEIMLPDGSKKILFENLKTKKVEVTNPDGSKSSIIIRDTSQSETRNNDKIGTLYKMPKKDENQNWKKNLPKKILNYKKVEVESKDGSKMELIVKDDSEEADTQNKIIEVENADGTVSQIIFKDKSENSQKEDEKFELENVEVRNPDGSKVKIVVKNTDEKVIGGDVEEDYEEYEVIIEI